MFEAVFELEAMYSLEVELGSLKRMAATLAVEWAGVKLVEPKVLDVGSEFALGPTMVGPELGQVPVPMDSNELEAVLGAVLGKIGGELVMETMQ